MVVMPSDSYFISKSLSAPPCKPKLRKLKKTVARLISVLTDLVLSYWRGTGCLMSTSSCGRGWSGPSLSRTEGLNGSVMI